MSNRVLEAIPRVIYRSKPKEREVVDSWNYVTLEFEVDSENKKVRISNGMFQGEFYCPFGSLDRLIKELQDLQDIIGVEDEQG